MHRKLLTWVVALALPTTLFAADWAQFRGPWANGISAEKGISKQWPANGPKMLWRVAMSDNGYAGPAAAGGRVYIVDHKGANDIVRALDIRTGKDVWTFSYPDAPKDNYGFARATPTVSGGKVYTLSRTGMLHCLNAANGKKVWGANIMQTFGGVAGGWDLAGSPLIDQGKVIVAPGGAQASVVALNKDTGKTIWKCAANDKAGYATAVAAKINGRSQYVVFLGTKLVGVDAASGRLLWSVPWKTTHDVNAAAPIVMENSIFITSNYGRGCALVDVSGNSAKIRWQNRDIQSHFSSPILARGMLFSTSDPGYLVCMDPKTGRVAWKQRGFEKGGMIGVDGAFIVMDGARGDIVMFEANTQGYRELGRFNPLGGQSWTAPIIADGKLIVRNKQAMACFALK